MKHDVKDSGFSDSLIDQTMAAFRAALTRMDASPTETARIRNLANVTDAQLTAEANPLFHTAPALSQRVYEHLRDEILADRLLPGTELSEVALSKELAISRGPIREALGRLAAEGLISRGARGDGRAAGHPPGDRSGPGAARGSDRPDGGA